MDESILARIETAVSLPTLPHILLQLIDICNREEKGIRDLTRIINQDPSMSERILRLVNSAYYSLKQKVTSIEQALLLLGMDAVKNLAISSSVYQVFHRPRRGSAFDLKMFWWHSLACAAIARRLALRMRYPSPDEAFLSGLMHDIGKIVLWVNFEEDYEKVLKAAGSDSRRFLEGERRLGMDHAEVGAWLIRHWELRSFVPDALRYHHDPPDRIAHGSPLVQIVYAANRLCPVASEEKQEGLEVAERVLGVKQRVLGEAVSEALEEVRGIAESLDIDISSPPVARGGLSARDREKYDRLAGWVRDISLLQSSSESFLKAEDRSAILRTVRQGLGLLFDVREIFLLGYEGDALVGMTMGGEEQEDVIRDLIVPFRKGSSVLVKAVAEQRILDTFDLEKPWSILDEQLVRFLGSEGMCCLPMLVGSDPLGVLILGIDRAGRDALLKRRELLTMFLNLSALALNRFQVREREAARTREERLAAASLVARKVVHEAHNPLGIISNYLGILSSKLAGNESVQEDLRIVREEIRRVSQIIGRLSSFSLAPQIENASVSVNAVVQDLARLSAEALRQKAAVTLELNLGESLPEIVTDQNKLKQVLLNLLKNAAEAMPGGGNVVLQTRYRDGQPPTVEILVRDSGSGIPESMRERLFEPFAGTKGREGLGLSIVQGIVKELGGSLSYETGGEGTTFIVRLPASSPAGAE